MDCENVVVIMSPGVGEWVVSVWFWDKGGCSVSCFGGDVCFQALRVWFQTSWGVVFGYLVWNSSIELKTCMGWCLLWWGVVCSCFGLAPCLAFKVSSRSAWECDAKPSTQRVSSACFRIGQRQNSETGKRQSKNLALQGAWETSSNQLAGSLLY